MFLKLNEERRRFCPFCGRYIKLFVELEGELQR